jgi:hypothetical protein
LSAAKEIALKTDNSINTPEVRKLIFSQIDTTCKRDPIYRAGVEAAPGFKRLRNQQYSSEGVSDTSPVKKYP